MNNNVYKMYKLQVYKKAFGHETEFQITFMENGWEIINPPTVGGICDKYGKHKEGEKGKEGLIECFNQDNIIYPSHIEFYFSGLYERIVSGEYNTPEIIQEKFNEIGNWIVELNKNAPNNIEI